MPDAFHYEMLLIVFRESFIYNSQCYLKGVADKGNSLLVIWLIFHLIFKIHIFPVLPGWGWEMRGERKTEMFAILFSPHLWTTLNKLMQSFCWPSKDKTLLLTFYFSLSAQLRIGENNHEQHREYLASVLVMKSMNKWRILQKEYVCKKHASLFTNLIS